MVQIQGSRVFNEQYQDIYFSSEDGMAESDYVFLQGNDLPHRFSHWNSKRAFQIGELGFGTGLNFVMTRRLFLNRAPESARLHFISFESHLPSPAMCRRSLSLFPDLKEDASLLRKKLRGVLQKDSGCHTLDFGRVRLTLFLGDARQTIQSFAGRCDAWYLDGFAPAKNPELWSPELLKEVQLRCVPGATASSFTAAGEVRRLLAERGFQVERIAGFGRKKHMIRAVLTGGPSAAAENPANPGDGPSLRNGTSPGDGGHGEAEGVLNAGAKNPRARQRPVVHIVGAGLAGLATAFAFRRRGFATIVYEKASDVAAGASGNLAGMAAAALTTEPTAASLISLRSQSLFISWAMDQDRSWRKLGMIRKKENADRYVRSIESHGLSHAFYSKARHELLMGWAGSVAPAILCKFYLEACRGPEFEFRPDYRVRPEEVEESRLKGDIWILCASNDLHAFQDTRFIPFKPVRGQVIHIPQSEDEGQRLRWPLTNQIYAVPVPSNPLQLVLGATFDMHLDQPHRLAVRDAYLLEEMKNKLPELFDALPAVRSASEALQSRAETKAGSNAGELGHGEFPLEGRVGFRCQSRDYLPVCGQVPDFDQFLARHGEYYRLSAQKKQSMDLVRESESLPRRKGVYVNACHGSRGITTSFLAAEVLASEISGEDVPLEKELRFEIDPVRFLWRLVRQPPERRQH
ncbi:MAG: tRNA (5-methylaminomethyl-2-thiouridine)(34)-methyltransferase MnmD [Leptospiraceae bacterium]|nr:tRNA (5-methylaminomethyl-2-thiouridine)(34)-methyltransferase MnmD [Leptospiraceae bacterium]